MSYPELQLQLHLRTAEQVGDTWEGPDDYNRLNGTQECVVTMVCWLQCLSPRSETRGDDPLGSGKHL